MRIGDAQAAAIARLHLAFAHTQGGRPADALALLESCRGDLARFGLAWEEGASWLLAAWAQHRVGERHRRGEAACGQALALLASLGRQLGPGARRGPAR